MEDLEYRYSKDVVKAASDSREVYGLLVPYNKPTTVAGVFEEVVEPGVFANRAGTLFVTRQHKREITLGRLGKNLFLEDTDEGMTFRAMMPKSPWGEDTLVLVREGILTGASVQWLVQRDRWDRLPGMGGVGLPKRTVIESNLRHFSIVDTPEYEEATISARAKRYLDKYTGREESEKVTYTARIF